MLVGRPFLSTTAVHPLPVGGATMSLVIPNDAALCGQHGFLQMFQQDPFASHGIAFTQGIDLALGD